MVNPFESDELLGDLEDALQEDPEGGFGNASLSRTYGIEASQGVDEACTVEVEDSSLREGETGEGGAIVSIHHLYMDPALTDCSRRQSVIAGRSFLSWLRRAGIRLDFVGSSFLQRAVETAVAMFVEPCQSGFNCSSLMNTGEPVTPIPYMTERSLPGRTSFQADNVPRGAKAQERIIEELYGRRLPIDNRYSTQWPRREQQFEKFKAFFATQVLPRLGGESSSWSTAPPEAFKAALEGALPEEMNYLDHGKGSIDFSWAGGSYATGADFSKIEYHDLDAPEVNIAIVGHSSMMLEYCLEGVEPKPNNNGVMEKLFVVEASTARGEGGAPDTRTIMRELAGRCATVMDAPASSHVRAHLAEADVATCTSPFNVSKYIRLDSSAGPSQSTACMASSEAEGAYPIQPDFQHQGNGGAL